MVARHAVIHEIAVAFAKYPPIKWLVLDDAIGQVKLEGWLYIVFFYFHAHALQLSPIFSFVKLQVSLEYILGVSRPPTLEPGYG